MRLHMREKKTLKIEGMTCNTCVENVKKALSKNLNGVNLVAISLDNQCAILDHVEGLDQNEIKKAIKSAGYNVTSIE